MEKPIIFPIMRHSDEAEKGAEELIRDIKSGKIKPDINPFIKSYEFLNNIIIEREEASFFNFLQSDIGQSIVDTLLDFFINTSCKNKFR